MPILDRLIFPVINRYLSAITSDGSYQTNSGQAVSGSSFFELVPIRAAITVLSQDVAVLPLKLYKQEGRYRTEVTDHPLSQCLKVSPNPRMTGYEWREAQMVSLLTWGNAYGYKMRDGLGRVTEIWPLRPDRMRVYLEGGMVVYQYRPADEAMDPVVFDSSEIIHIKGLSADGLAGRSPLADFREKLGEIAASERFTQSFYGNGMKRSAVLKHPKTLSDEAHRRLKASVDDESGANKAFKVLILEEGLDFSELSFSPEDAQLLESRRFSVEDAARIFNLPAYKLRLNTPGTVSYASVDAQAVDYLVSSLTPWLVRIEQAVNKSCLSDKELADGYFVEHNTRALLRSDLKSQAEALKIGREMNWYSPNDCREKLGENPIADSRADDYFAPTVTNPMPDYDSPGEESGDEQDTLDDE